MSDVTIPALADELGVADLLARVEQLEADRGEMAWYVAKLEHALRKLIVQQILAQPAVQDHIQQQLAEALGRV